ncbi:transcriptional regulator PpsR [Erythrobacter sp. EC-HK427]|uniref:transcriptional regulator PpsR n=1 Tax=Erythrobacter sp. EC-HK427 TaxID=2038396 RepID=UPI00125700B2|nr:transcriptional regulator PpsR [Erythrobacter sp. EC-HK427]VVT11175.1 Transcriptional regulator [Erythrobacter sp. EC-HK427]
MLTRKHSIEGKLHFGDFAGIFDDCDPEAAAKLALIAGDISLVIDRDGVILGGSADPVLYPELEGWIGQAWLDTVTADSRGKVNDLIASMHAGRQQRWRQINHHGNGADIPVRYAIVSFENTDRCLALGRDMREEAALQQRFLQAQQALERDYLRLRQAEQRYRLLFDEVTDAVLVVEADTHRIREANPAAHRVLKIAQGELVGNRLSGVFARGSRDALIGFLGAATATQTVSPLSLALASDDSEVALSTVTFRQRGKPYLFVRITAPTQVGDAHRMLDIVQRMPDAFVLANSAMQIVAVNTEFAELVGAAHSDQLIGKPLGHFIGRPGIDLELVKGQLAKDGVARNVSTVVGANDDFQGEPVELSAVQTESDDPHLGMVIRPVGRRLRDLQPAAAETPRSVEQLTELVGRMSLKDIVRESTDLIERLCIEAALSRTADNRASAAEILGLSRQSLYSKLHRHGLGNLGTDGE